ncbi:MAG: hypothetical protein WBR18_03630 [Anaerolineales bacterium]
MMMRGRPIVPFFGSLFLIALVVGAGALAYNAGAAEGSFFGVAVSPVVAGLLSVLLLLFVLRLAAPLLLVPLFGFGFMRMRRHGFGHGWGRHGWKRGWGGMHDRQDWERGVPPMVAEWHRRLHETEAESGVEGSDTA